MQSYRIILLVSCLLTVVAAAHADAEDDIARPLLTQALENQFHGRYNATMELVHDNFTCGKDSLVGTAEFADDVGERRLTLAGPRKAFEYRSLNFGKEQWITDDASQRVRRIANRQWRKGVFGTLLTYEDMLKLPADFFLEYSSCKSLRITDSSYQISMLLKPIYQSFYSRLDVELSKHPVLVKNMVFYGTHGEKLKSMVINEYQEVEGKWLASEVALADSDSLSSLRMRFGSFSFTHPPQTRKDRTQFTMLSKHPLVLPAGTEGAASTADGAVPEEGSNDINN